MLTTLSRTACALIVSLAILSATATPAASQGRPSDAEVIAVNEGKLIRFSRPAAKVFVANPDIADVQVPGDRAVFIFGKETGQTTLYALDDADRTIVSQEISVVHDTSRLGEVLDREAPRAGVQLTSIPGGIVLKGRVQSPDIADNLVEIARGFIGADERIVNRLEIQAPLQVNLRVRVAEMSRRVSKELGFNWEAIVNAGSFAFGLATGREALNAAGQVLRAVGEGNPGTLFGSYSSDSGSVTGVVDALEDEGLVSILAEPNLTALSGETASFLAGGEFPIPVAEDDGEVSVEFKRFGVSLDFTPTVLNPKRISLKVRPEVSELSPEAGVTTGGVEIPGLSVRRAETTIELGSGQSFAIAGLLQSSSSNGVNQVPGLGDMPVLGPLFQSTDFQRDETELVIVVTPYIVRPTNDSEMNAPGDGFRPPSDLERILMGRVASPAGPKGDNSPLGVGGLRLIGPAGFAY